MKKKFTSVLLGLTLISVFGLLLISAKPENQTKPTKAKYVFLLIGDGMGVNQAMITNQYLQLKGQDLLSFTRFPNVAVTTTNCSEADKNTDSAASGTAIATGRKTNFHVLGKDTVSGEEFVSVAEHAKQCGMKVGILSSVGLNHATPAAFYGNDNSRSHYANIALQMGSSNFDYFAGGGVITKDKIQLDVILKDLESHKYKVITDFNPKTISASRANRMYCSNFEQLDAASVSMPYAIDRETPIFTLADYLSYGIQYLENPDGFFVMAEGGKIDWASHGNDAATVVHEVIDFDNAVKVALEFYKKHPEETLIIVTADHETGGMSFGSDDMKYDIDFLKLDAQKISKQQLQSKLTNSEIDEYASIVEQNMKLQFAQKRLENLTPEQVADLVVDSLDRAAGVSWTSSAHTGMPVLTYAIGVGSEKFNGIIDNTDIIKFIEEASVIEEK